MSRHTRAARAVLASLVLALPAWSQTLGAPSVGAPAGRTPADSALEARTRLVASQLRCPVCQGLSLQDSPSELSQEMKDVVRAQLAAGKSPEDVKRFFVEKYGEWILMAPEPRRNWAVYALPPLALLAGAGVIVMVVRRWTARVDTPV